MFLVNSVSYAAGFLPDSINDLEEDKKAVIVSLEKQIEQLQSEIIKLEIKIQQHNKDLRTQKETIKDRNFMRLEAIHEKLIAEMEDVREVKEGQQERLKEAKLTLNYLKDEIKDLIGKIEKKLHKSSRKT